MLVAVAAHTDRQPKTLDREWLDEIALNGGLGWDGPATLTESTAGLVEIGDVHPRRDARLACAGRHSRVMFDIALPAGWKNWTGLAPTRRRRSGRGPGRGRRVLLAAGRETELQRSRWMTREIGRYAGAVARRLPGWSRLQTR